MATFQRCPKEVNEMANELLCEFETHKPLLDHELHHIAIKVDKRGLVRDDLGRPAIQLRKHDYEFGWFKVVAARHGQFSQERLQAAQMMCDAGQYFWPLIESSSIAIKAA